MRRLEWPVCCTLLSVQAATACALALALAPTNSASADQESEPASSQPNRPFRMSGNQILADRFAIRASIQGDRLTVALDTDLGDSTVVYVDVSRFYRPPGHHAAYPVSYFSQSGTVGDWRRPRVLQLNEELWRRELASRRTILAVLERPIAETFISDDVVVRFLAPPYQPPPFAARNANLQGKAVEVERDARYVSKSIAIRHPIESAGPDRPQ